MTRTHAIRATAILAALGLAAAAAPALAQEAAKEAAKLQVSKQDPYGAYLTDAEGSAVYLFTKDREGESACTGACAEAWPPVLTKGDPQAEGPDVKKELLGTIQRPDGATQVTYAGKPLYYFQKDQAPGQVKGQDVQGFGGEWYVLSPAGQQIEATQAQPTPAALEMERETERGAGEHEMEMEREGPGAEGEMEME